MWSVRMMLAYSVVTFFLFFFLYSGVRRDFAGWESLISKTGSGTPDFSQYKSLETLSAEQFPIEDRSRRAIIVGDIHGMHDQLQKLLTKLSYDPSTDVLVSVGDIVAKGPHSGSMAVLKFMTTHNITAVRGNHDQKVIEWKSWLNWIYSLPGGKNWLQDTQKKWEAAQKAGEQDAEHWVSAQMKSDKSQRKWWRRIPKGWKLFSDHHRIASEMTDEQYDYMVSRPLMLHIPHAHTFIAHAGILASDPNYKPSHRRQPLARVPTLPPSYKHGEVDADAQRAILRRLQEVAVLKEVPQNMDPWNVLNMRGVLEDHSITRGKGGTPWTKLYKKDMLLCDGFNHEIQSAKHRKDQDTLPCHPTTVVYGHAASRGLDVKRWTIGLDSGCVYQRRLTAIVLGGQTSGLSPESVEAEDDDDAIDIDGQKMRSKVKFGDTGHGRIRSVSCG